MDLQALEEILSENGPRVAAMMVTYPSTFGIFDPVVPRAIEMVHEAGGQVYLDGANVNAQVGLTSPGRIGADVCHLNLHKTFAIPHGGGGPGVGPVLTAAHLTPYLPGTPDNPGPTGVVVAAPAGSAGVFAVSYGYIAMLGARGSRASSERAILGANYIAARLASRVEIAYSGAPGDAASNQSPGARQPRVAHECILDFRRVEKETGVTVEDIAKRLIDYGFHAPTMSWPVAGTLMVEPTESESKEEIDRFCDAMLSIMDEIDEIRTGTIAVEESPLRLAPHTAEDIAGQWERSYSREKGVYPAQWIRERKYWPPVNRVDNPYGDRNLFCTCEPLETWKEPAES
jgi:glycine dehydrogenase